MAYAVSQDQPPAAAKPFKDGEQPLAVAASSDALRREICRHVGNPRAP